MTRDERSSRRPLGRALPLALLLLFACAILSTVQVFVETGPEQVRFVARNIECLQCHSDLIPDVRAELVHNPFRLGQCTVCHTPHGRVGERTTWVEQRYREVRRWVTVLRWVPLTWLFPAGDPVTEGQESVRILSRETVTVAEGAPGLVASVEVVCLQCHARVARQYAFEHRHRPFDQGNCIDCHNPHASRWEGLLVTDPQTLCMACHGSIGEEMTRAQRHDPAERFFCTGCHDPHASDWEGVLIERERELCFSCHPSVAWLSNKSVQHEPFRYDQCTGCHEPHAADAKPLLIDSEPALCYGCHSEVEGDFAQVSIHPVYTPLLQCSSCHDPHAADYPALVSARDNELCYQCHTAGIRARFERSEHRNLLCVRCHTPHGSAWTPILHDQNPDVCLRCHAWVESHDNQHPVRPVYYDIRAGEGLTCTSTCHDPHGGRYAAMLRFYAWPFDGRCLQCHSTVGEDF